MNVNLPVAQKYFRGAETQELLDHLTVYRELLEPEAIELLEVELVRRGVTNDVISQHDEERRKTALIGSDGLVLSCSICRIPAVRWDWNWHRLFGLVPVFPRWVRVCAKHGGAREPQATTETQ